MLVCFHPGLVVMSWMKAVEKFGKGNLLPLSRRAFEEVRCEENLWHIMLEDNFLEHENGVYQ